MKTIKLTQGKFAIVDDEDFLRLNKYKWCAQKIKNNWYAVRTINRKTQKQKFYMHREILGLKSGDSDVDHINQNGLDNRKANLRFCSKQQNRANTTSCKGTSKFRGVHWVTNRFKWAAIIKFNGQIKFLGHFVNEIKAAKAYDKRAKELFGEFAKTNF